MALAKANKIGLMYGVPFILLVVSLLLYLHVFGVATVAKPRHQGAAVPDLLACEREVLWVNESVANKALQFWRDQGHPMGSYVRVPCGSLQQCQTTDAQPRRLPCSGGNIVVSLQDQQFELEHLGETVSVFDPPTGKIAWATIVLPSAILSPDLTRDGQVQRGLELPHDVEALVLAHEIGHWLGFDHARTVLCGPVVSEPTGHILNPSIFKQGWDGSGLRPAKD